MSIRQIKVFLCSVIGSKIVVIYNGSRNRKEKYCGILLAVYNNIFTIKTPVGELKCFSYIDILTKTIQIYI